MQIGIGGSLQNATNKRRHNRPLRGLDLNRCADFGLCSGRYMPKGIGK